MAIDPLLLALVAIVWVILGVLCFRLHAFLTLTLGALLVAILTPTSRLYRDAISQTAAAVQFADTSSIVFASGQPVSGDNVVLRPGERDELDEIGHIYLRKSDTNSSWERDTTDVVLQPGDLVMHVRDLDQAKVAPRKSAGERIADGFGDTCSKIGILIAMAAVIGNCLLESGAAQRVVNATRRLVGDDRTPLAFTLSGFVVGIPVFFDTVFYLLMPLARAMRIKTGHSYLLYVLSIVVGATMAHSLVPPTPGPLFVAAEMGVDIGTMICGGTIVGLTAVTCGFLCAIVMNRIWDIPLRDNPFDERSEKSTGTSDRNDHKLPPLAISLAPIALPVAALTSSTLLNTSLQSYAKLGRAAPTWMLSAKPYVDFFGDKNVALIIAAIIALATLVVYRKSAGTTALLTSLEKAVSSGGVIILITSAGGAFGQALRQCGVAEAIQHQFPGTEDGLTLLWIAFIVTAIVRFAQGSATVAMITSVGIVGPIAQGIELPYHPVYLALAIGCGSKLGPWMNDSGFWVVGRMSGMTESETLKTYSVVLTMMGGVGFLVTFLGAKWLPLLP